MMRDITHSDGVLPPWDWLMAFPLNAESKETNRGREWTTDGALPGCRRQFFLFLLTLRRLFLMLICYCCIFHPQLLTWNETGPDKHTLALTSLTQEADRSSSTDKFSPLCHGVDANLWTVLPIRFVTFQQKTPTPPPSDEQQMWTGTVFLMSSHVHPKTMQLSSPLSVPHYHNCICGSSHCNNLAHVQERLTCCRFRLRRLCRGWSFGSTLAVSRCLPEVLITP